mmetsp:Transcript_28182/g.87337  ORF Transcript_28182/g.87337 Transcript_28182/m.87337 type:complete len:223 (-) Transcript_28182:214-882(-)
MAKNIWKYSRYHCWSAKAASISRFMWDMIRYTRAASTLTSSGRKRIVQPYTRSWHSFAMSASGDSTYESWKSMRTMRRPPDLSDCTSMLERVRSPWHSPIGSWCSLRDLAKAMSASNICSVAGRRSPRTVLASASCLKRASFEENTSPDHGASGLADTEDFMKLMSTLVNACTSPTSDVLRYSMQFVCGSKLMPMTSRPCSSWRRNSTRGQRMCEWPAIALP